MALGDVLREASRAVAKAALQAAGDAARSLREAIEPENESVNRDFDEFLEKASNSAKVAGKDGTHELSDEPKERKAMHFDPFDLVAAMGYRERPSPMTYAAMERVGRTVPVISDIIQTRTNQVVLFCERPSGRHNSGFMIKPKDPDQKPTKATKKRGTELEDILLHCGQYDKLKPGDTTNFVDFTKMFIQDSLIFDAGCIEIVEDRKGRPNYFAIVDASTVRLLDPGYRDTGDPFAVQVINGSIVSDFRRNELAYCVRNPRSGIRAHGYGLSEIETLVKEITGLLWGMAYNMNFFKQGSATKGILNFKGTIPDAHLRAFRRQWYTMVSGVANAFRTPITNAEELQWINMQLSNKDMEYSAWLDFLIKIACSRYNIAPEEINFSYGNAGQASAMGQNPVEEKIKASKDLGLRPLVIWYFTQLNDYFISRIDPDFEAVAVGLDDAGEQAETELIQAKCSVYMTIDEARMAVDLEPIGEENGGNVIENAVWIQWYNVKQQADQMAQQGGAMGPDGQPMEGGQPEPGQGGEDDFEIQDEIGLDDDVDSQPDTAIKSKRDQSPLTARYTLDL